MKRRAVQHDAWQLSAVSRAARPCGAWVCPWLFCLAVWPATRSGASSRRRTSIRRPNSNLSMWLANSPRPRSSMVRDGKNIRNFFTPILIAGRLARVRGREEERFRLSASGGSPVIGCHRARKKACPFRWSARPARKRQYQLNCVGTVGRSVVLQFGPQPRICPRGWCGSPVFGRWSAVGPDGRANSVHCPGRSDRNASV